MRSTSTYTGNHECILNAWSSLLYRREGYSCGLSMPESAGDESVIEFSSLFSLWAESSSASGHL